MLDNNTNNYEVNKIQYSVYSKFKQLDKSIVMKLILACCDMIALTVSLVLATLLLDFIRPGAQDYEKFSHLGIAKLAGLLIILVFWYQEQYSKRRPVWEELRQTYSIIFIFAVLHLGFTYLVSHHVIKLLNVVFWGLLLVVLPSLRYCVKIFLTYLGLWTRKVYIVGTGVNAYDIFKLLGANQKNGIMGYQVVGLVNLNLNMDVIDTGVSSKDNFDENLKLPIYTYDKLLNILVENKTTSNDIEIICALSTEELLLNIHKIDVLQTKCNFISVIPDIRGIPLYGAELNHFFGSDQLFLRLQNNLGRRINRIIKRVVDVVLAAIGLIILSPLFLCFAIILKLTVGQVFFKHRRIGSMGKYFSCIKFQTMYPNSAEILKKYLSTNEAAKHEWEQTFKLKDDPRVTLFGKFLRKTSLDELPQLWNVLVGEMSLVGPRPIVADEISRYQDDFYYYKLVRPGVTGLWQVSGRSNTDYADRVRLDVWYVKNWSLWYDFVILLKTVSVVLGRKGAY